MLLITLGSCLFTRSSLSPAPNLREGSRARRGGPFALTLVHCMPVLVLVLVRRCKGSGEEITHSFDGSLIFRSHAQAAIPEHVSLYPKAPHVGFFGRKERSC